MENFPRDIVIHILSYLPLRAVLRASQVCKLWNSTKIQSYANIVECVNDTNNLIWKNIEREWDEAWPLVRGTYQVKLDGKSKGVDQYYNGRFAVANLPLLY